MEFGHQQAKEPAVGTTEAQTKIPSEKKNCPCSDSQSFVPELRMGFDSEKTMKKSKRLHTSSLMDLPSPEPIPQSEPSQIPQFEHQRLRDLHLEPIPLD